jgi:Mrp family chromosome partitioning ATPase
MSKFVSLLQQLEMEPAGLYPATSVLPSEDDDHSSGDDKTRKANDEASRLVRQIFLRQKQEPPRVVVFAGINHRDGCSHISADVAKTLARNTLQSVCLVEANFRSPSLPRFFGTPNHHGLTDAILGQGPVISFAKLVSGDNMWLLSAGAPVNDAKSLIASDPLRQRLAELREEFNFVLIDAPPLRQYSDAIVLSHLADGIVLILEGESSWREGAEVVAHLRSIDVPILAAVLNKHSLAVP